jgi:hypothetical protein
MCVCMRVYVYTHKFTIATKVNDTPYNLYSAQSAKLHVVSTIYLIILKHLNNFIKCLLLLLLLLLCIIVLILFVLVFFKVFNINITILRQQYITTKFYHTIAFCFANEKSNSRSIKAFLNNLRYFRG